MAEINVNGHMKVKTLKAEFKQAFGATLRVYKSTHFADDEATLASVRGEDGAKTGEFICGGKMTVEAFEKDFKEIFGITVQVANADNTKLSRNDATLETAG